MKVGLLEPDSLLRKTGMQAIPALAQRIMLAGVGGRSRDFAPCIVFSANMKHTLCYGTATCSG